MAKTTHSCFVAMPFGTRGEYAGGERESELIWEGIIRRSVLGAKLTLRPHRAGKGEGEDEGAITPDIVRRLENAHLVIADLTGNNPNVMVEVGIRMALHGRGLVLMSQKPDELPFDLKDERCVPYEASTPEQIAKAVSDLTVRVRTTFEQRGNPTAASPVFRALGWSSTGLRSGERDVGSKAAASGLVGIGCRASDLPEWRPLADMIEEVPDGSDLLVVGRSLISWKQALQTLGRAISERGVKCKFVVADPNESVRSLIHDDGAQTDVRDLSFPAFVRFCEGLAKSASSAPAVSAPGVFELRTIPAYLPESLVFHLGPGSEEFCLLDFGMAMDRDVRPTLVFRKLPSACIYSGLASIYRGIARDADLVCRWPDEGSV